MPNPLTTAEAAERAGVDVRTIHRWVASGRLTPTHKLPGATGAYLFAAEDVEAIIEPTEAAS